MDVRIKILSGFCGESPQCKKTIVEKLAGHERMLRVE